METLAQFAKTDEKPLEAADARAVAVELARDGRLGDALGQLTSAWAAERNRALDDDAADLAALHLASGEPARAFAALEVGVRGRTRVGERARGMLAQCVAEEPGRLWRALAIAGSAGSLRDRISIGRAVVAARLRGDEAAPGPARTRAPA